MKTESLLELISLCRSSLCSIKLESTTTSVVANITANRGDVTKTTSVWLYANDSGIGAKLEDAVRRVQ